MTMKKPLLTSFFPGPLTLGPLTIDKRLLGYGAMSMAIAAAAAPGANAGVVYWPTDITTPVGGGIYFDVVTGSTTAVSSNSSLEPGAATGRFALEDELAGQLQKAFVVASASNKFAVTASDGVFGNPSSAARLAVNTTIGGTLDFANYAGVANSLASNFAALGHWNGLGSDYLALEFVVGSQTDYGWAHITINPDYTVTLDGMAYNDSGSPIAAAETPPDRKSVV